jgi:hypothetical protein
VTADDAATYTVIVNGACGSVTNSATLAVNTAVAATPLVSLTKCPGESASFNTVASGTGPFSYFWLKNTTLLSNTSDTLAIASVTADDAGTYTVIVNGACGSVTNSATLNVNTLLAATPLVSLVKCPGEDATFNTVASGTGPFSYVWFKNNQPLSHTGDLLSLTNVTSEDTGIYTVVVSGACGSVTNHGSLIVNETPRLGALLFTALANGATQISVPVSGTGPFTVTWSRDGSILSQLTNLEFTALSPRTLDAGNYRVEIAGVCGVSVTTFSLPYNVPPAVNIVSPTNNTVLLTPADVRVLADAFDTDGQVVKVEFFDGLTNKLSEVTNGSPYVTMLTNLPAGSYTLFAVATDNDGGQGISAPVNFTVAPSLPVTVGGPIRLNYQTGFWEQQAVIHNTTGFELEAVGVVVNQLPALWRLQNATFTTNNMPGVLYNQPIAPGAVGYVTLKYLLRSGADTNAIPVLSAIRMSPSSGANVIGSPVQITRSAFLADGSFLLNFSTVPNATYYVQYTEDLQNWKTSPQQVRGTGLSVQWLDYGPPSTDALPSQRTARFYRVIQVQ